MTHSLGTLPGASKPLPGQNEPGQNGADVFASPVCLLLHGAEDITLGGPSVRVPRTAEALRGIGVPARSSNFHRASDLSEDTVHLFNVWPPESALQSLRQLKAAGKRVVFSPIYLDFSERSGWTLSAAEHQLMRRHLQARGRQNEIIPGYHAMVREMVSLADHVVFLSKTERAALAAIGATVPEDRASLVYNPVDATLWQDGDPALFRSVYADSLGDADYIICVGRIEPRKNQLALAMALRGLPLRLVLAGHEGDPAYAAQIRQIAGPQLILPGRLAPGGAMLRSALSGARAFALPSWAEGASLAALEAAAAGIGLILSDRSSEQEYFGDLAQYCDPSDPSDLRDELCKMLADKDIAIRAAKLRDHVTQTLDWSSHARATQAAYTCAAKMPLRKPAVPKLAVPKLTVESPQGIAIDVTALTRTAGASDQNLRYTEAFAHALLALDTPPRLIFWCLERLCFLDLPGSSLAPANARRYAMRAALDDSLPSVHLDISTIILLGGIWVSDAAYFKGLEDIKAVSGAGLIALIEDVGPCLRPDLFCAADAEGYTARLQRLVQISDHLIVPSAEAAKALNLALETGPTPPQQGGISVLPLPALPISHTAPDPALRAQLEGQRFALVAGPVAVRGNLTLLTRIWARFAASGLHPDFHLVIAGGVAKDGAAFAEQIRRDPRIAKRIHIVTAEGADLGWLYQHAVVALCPSESEGWDWPVIESLAHGTPCIIADIPALTGHACNTVEAIDPDDLPAWQHSIGAYASSIKPRIVPDTQRPQDSWFATAEKLAALARQPRTIKFSRSLRAGEIASAGRHAAPLMIDFGKGWHPAQEHIRWAACGRAEIKLRADRILRTDQDHLLVHLCLNAALPEPRRARLRVTSGETCLYDAPVGAASLPHDLLLLVPVTLLDDIGCLPLTLHLPALAVSSFPVVDQAPVILEPRGIGLVSASLLDAEWNNPLAVLPHSNWWSEGRERMEIDLGFETHRAAVAPDLSYGSGWGVGSLRPQFAVFVPILPGAAPQTLDLTLRPVADATSASGACIFWNGRLLAKVDWDKNQPVHLSYALTPADLLAAPAVLEIIPTAYATPADLGLGHEQNIAGVGLIDVALTPVKPE